MATNRLRRRLEEADPATLARLSENFCQIGTPLPSLENRKRDPNEYKPIWQQEARDEQGRRRFHGAFTGGFSAGYFNTVGSKEGWTPSSFRSSRADKAKGGQSKTTPVQSRPEDFMDEEDLADLRDSARLKTSSTFQDAADPSHDPLLGLFVLVQLEGRQDRTGLGWKRSSSLNELLTEVRSEAAGQRPGEPSGRPVFAPSGADSDDEADVFAGEPDIRTSTLVRSSRTDARAAMTSIDAPKRTTEMRTADGVNTWLDGRKVAVGFRVASKSMAPDPWFAPPIIPKGWKPNPQAIWDSHAPTMAPAAAPGRVEGSAPKALDPTARGTILGEARMPGPPPALSDFLSTKARERLAAAAAGASLPQEPAGPAPPPAIEIPPTDPATAKAALHGFMPFGDDPAKQSRYRTYLQSQADPASNVQVQRSPGQLDDHFQHELREFAKSAAIFRPMSTAMASRFTSASSKAAAQETAPPAPGLRQPQPRPAPKSQGGEGDHPAEPEVELTPAQHAAKAGMFGRLTRTVEPWYPVRLLCKRFNVPDPHPGRTEDDNTAVDASRGREEIDPFCGSSSARNRAQADVGANDMWDRNKRQIQDLAQAKAWEASAPRAPPSAAAAASATGRGTAHGGASSRSIETLGLGDDERQGADTTTYVKPSVDIFKAIFASDEEDSDADDDNDALGAKRNTSAANREEKHKADESLGDPSTSFRPTFVPRSKRKAHGDELAGEARGCSDEGGGAIKKKADKKQKKDKRNKAKGMLTFDLDGEDDMEHSATT
ncbi:uncharacterized protein PSFLO_06182 [Pseudozyma flocculosa]|uniref:G patch domain-containing protein n=1 Tax=Pseudozyma flocculosa TaxID=84751 RepID=A0A5C3F8X5_9BASI|nr:uncharacterized protein PSFLO_06182 [Pseudozyma flocculosa]